MAMRCPWNFTLVCVNQPAVKLVSLYVVLLEVAELSMTLSEDFCIGIFSFSLQKNTIFVKLKE